MVDTRTVLCHTLYMMKIDVATQMMVICAWCDAVQKFGPLPASHGICPTCAAKMQKELDAIVARVVPSIMEIAA